MATELMEEMDLKMNEFHQSFKSTIQNRKTELLNRRIQYDSTREDLLLKQGAIAKKIEKLSEEELRIREQLNSELKNLNEAKLKIDELKNNQSTLEENKNSVLEKIAILNSQIDYKKTDLNKSKKSLNRNVQQDLNMVKLYESVLGLRFETIDDDVIKFVFFNLLQNDLDKTFEITLDLSNSRGDYKISSLSDNLPQQTVDKFLNTLNATRNLTLFLKSMRASFIESYAA